MNKKSKQIVVSVLLLFSFFLFPSMTFAQATPAPAADSGPVCTCFCGTDGGAEQAGTDKITSAKCEVACEAKGHQMVVCAKTTRQFPANNGLCFDSQACSDQKGELSKQQPPECPSGWKYCFPTAEKSMLKLSTKIGDLETVGDLGVYVSGVYKWMVGVAGLFAIIMVMIGGFQYVLGGAAQDQISKAKERMKNGVIGMVLLFSVVLILQTINPQLLKLEVPRPSKLREINLASNACEKLLAQGYTIVPEEGSKTECGGTAVIKSGPGGKKVADGLTCAYTKCAKGACVSMGNNAAGICAECRNVSKGNDKSPAKPTPAICHGMTTEVFYPNGNLKSANYCTFGLGDKDYFPSLDLGSQTSADVNINADSCMEAVVDCSIIKDCEDYDDIDMYYFDDDDTPEEQDIYDAARTYFGFFCTNDPCNTASKHKDRKGCHWDGDKDCDNVCKSGSVFCAGQD